MLRDCKDALTVLELATVLGIGKNTAYKMLQDGSISSLKIGRKYLVPKVCT